MLNRVSEKISTAPTKRVRLTKDERSKQLVIIGLKKLAYRPIQEVSLDEVAAEAGISRALLFHYFPTKAAYYEAVVRAAGRRVVHTVQPDADATGREALRQVITRYIARIARRREIYIALVRGNLSDFGGAEAADTWRGRVTDFVLDALADDGVSASPVTIRGWLAYVEDLALSWTSGEAEGERPGRDELVEHCEAALGALLAVSRITPLPWGENPTA
ncbi:TetR/AcrR family transcriptional regulator [Dermacoccus profundi]|uniref:TetR/AcrR family transcriptional regulator n=1 Tax=Dermacoccus profundi TaxID=322602 RepID=A0ABP4NUM7_9MICO